MAVVTPLSELGLRDSSLVSDQGWAPDTEPRFAGVLVDSLAGERPKPVVATEPARIAALGCDRQVGYDAAGVEPGELGEVEALQFSLSRWMRNQYKIALSARLVPQGWDVKLGEPVTVADSHGEPLAAGYADAVLTSPAGERIVVMYRPVDGFEFKVAAGRYKAHVPAEGPKYSHVLQLSLLMRAVDVDEGVIVVNARSAVGKWLAEDLQLAGSERIAAEWTFTREQGDRVADQWVSRIERTVADVERGLLPERRVSDPAVPDQAVIESPETGAWAVPNPRSVDAPPIEIGGWWGCAYCRHRARCDMDGPGRIEISASTMSATKEATKQ